MRFKRLTYLVLSIILSLSAAFAGGTASPFSRYGYGEFQNSVSGALLSMGGVGYGMRNSRVINPSNPASYSSIDSLTFMMDLGLSGVIDGSLTNAGRNTQFAGNIDYVSFQSAKKDHYTLVQTLANQFKEEVGSIICRDILKNPPSDPNPTPRTEEFYKQRPCTRMVMVAARILGEYIHEHPISK